MKIFKFYADWCSPCKAIAPQLDRLAKESGVPVEEVNVDTDPTTATQYRVLGLPTLVVVDDQGVELGRGSGSSAVQQIKPLLE